MFLTIAFTIEVNCGVREGRIRNRERRPCAGEVDVSCRAGHKPSEGLADACVGVTGRKIPWWYSWSEERAFGQACTLVRNEKPISSATSPQSDTFLWEVSSCCGTTRTEAVVVFRGWGSPLKQSFGLVEKVLSGWCQERFPQETAEQYMSSTGRAHTRWCLPAKGLL